MGIYTYDYSEMNNAAKRADKAAETCDKYAEKIKKNITSKLADLERGSNVNTSNANYFAQQKITKLGSKATDFRKLSEKIVKVKDKAKDTDADVAKYIKTESREFRKSHDMNVNVVMEFFAWLSVSVDNAFGFIRALKDAMSGIANWIDAKKRGFKEWFHLDGGRYILGIAIAAIGLVIAAVVLVVVAFPAFMAAAATLLAGTINGVTIWMMITATAGLVTAIIAVVDSATKIFTNVIGIATNESDPGWAFRQASIGSFAELLKKTVFNSKFANKLSMIVSHGIEIAAITASAINLLNTVHSIGNFIKDIKSKGGISKVFNKVMFKTKNGKVTFQTFKHGLKTVKKNIDIINKGFGKSTYSQLTQYYEPSSSKAWKAVKSMQKILKASNTVADKGYAEQIGNTIKEKLKGISIIYNYGSKVKDFIDSINKTKKDWNYATPHVATVGS